MKKNTCLLIALILGAVHLCTSVLGLLGGGIGLGMLGGMASSSSSASSLASLTSSTLGFATMLLLPHLALTAGGVVLSGIGLSKNNATQALIAGILYAIAFVTGFGILILAATVLAFVAFAQMNKPAE